MNLPLLRLLAGLAAATAACSSAQGTPAAAPPTSGAASSAAWGAPTAQAPASGAASKAGPSAFASARASSAATGDYFHDFAELILRVRSVKWIEEICSEAFPATAEQNEHAYDDWLMDHGPFLKEMEGQFGIIEKYWSDASPNAVKEGFTAEQLRAKVEANREGLRQDFYATSKVTFQRRCDAYPEILLSPQLDLEKSQADYVTSVRFGPR